MNFLIAIVADTYVNCQNESTNNVYFFRSELNLEYIEIFGGSAYSEQFNKILFMTESQDKLTLSVMGMIKQTKKTLLSVLESQSAFNHSKLDHLED